jgi:hypothetical protein
MPVARTGQVRRFCLKSNLSRDSEEPKLKPLALLLNAKSGGPLCLPLNESAIFGLPLSGATMRLWSTMPSNE